MPHFPYRLKFVKVPPAGSSQPEAGLESAASRGKAEGAKTSPGSQHGPGPRFMLFVRVLVSVLGFVSFLCVLTVGFFIISPSALPDSFRAACITERHGEHQSGTEDKDRNGVVDPPTSWQSDKDDRKCEAKQIPTELLICATGLTAFFFLGITVQLLAGTKIEAKDFEVEIPSQLGVDTARETAAGVAEHQTRD